MLRKLRTHLKEVLGVEVSIYYRVPLAEEVDPITGHLMTSHKVYNMVEDYHRFRDVDNKDGIYLYEYNKHLRKSSS